MVTNAAHLKQIFSFHSLRVIDKDDSSLSRKTCFSDSEIIDKNEEIKIDQMITVKSKSETCLDKIIKKSFGDEITKIISSNNVNDDEISVKNNNKLATRSSIKKSSGTENVKTFNIGGSKSLRGKEKLQSIRQKMLKAGIFKKVSENSIVSSQNLTTKLTNKSSPYGILEADINDGTMTENLLGEPRSITLKKQSGDINPFITDDAFMFEPDFEDDNGIFEEKAAYSKKKDQKKTDVVNDMFLDDEEIGMKKSTADKEEGELSPEGPLILPIDVDKNETDSKKKWDLEFFNKINECLRDLDGKCKEFYLSSTPDGSITSLQRTLNNVDSIKRKLSFLLKSKRIDSEKKKKESKLKKYSHAGPNSKNDIEQTDGHTKTEILLSSDYMIGASSYAKNVRRLYENMILDKQTASGRDDSYSNRRDERHEKQSERTSRYSSRRQRSSKDKPSQADLLNRKRTSILEKLGTKQEIERIQSLFKRQMNLITKHVQKSETEKSLTSSKYDSEKNKKHHDSQRQIDRTKETEKFSFSSLNTLEDMEDFLNKLKSRASDKALTEQYLEKEKQKRLLKFTSKKDKTLNKNTSLKSSKLSDATTHNKANKILNTSSECSIMEEKQQRLLPPAKADISESSSNKEIYQTLLSSIKESEMLQTDESRGKHKEIESKERNKTPIAITLDSSSINNQDQIRKGSSKTLNTSDHSKSKITKTPDKKETGSITKVIDNQKGKKIIQDFSPVEVPASTKNFDNKTSQSSERKDDDSSILNVYNTDNRDTRKSIKRKNGQSDSKSNDCELHESKKRIRKTTTEDLVPLRTSAENEEEDMVVNQFQKYLSQKEKDDKIARDVLVKDLLSKKIIILDDKNFATNNQFCIKVIGKEVFLKKVSNKRNRKHSKGHLKSGSSKDNRKNKMMQKSPSKHKDEIEPNLIEENINTTLEDMENFLEELRSKKIASDHEKEEFSVANPQSRELKFLARIQAKRKAKLMAHVSEGLTSSEKEAKFLKALKNQNQELSDSSDIEIKKQELMEKIRAETDAIVLAEKPRKKQREDDPLMDVKEFLNMLKEAENTSEEKSKQFYVSFSLKRSDVKKLENLATGKTSSLSEESQKLLNNVRSKMKAKKASTSNIRSLMQKPEM